MRFEQFRAALRPLRVRLFIWITLAVFIMVGATMLIVWLLVSQELRAAFDNLLKAEAGQVIVALENPSENYKKTLNDKARFHKTGPSRESDRRHWFVEVFDKNGARIWWTDEAPDHQDLPPPPMTGGKLPPSDWGPYRMLFRMKEREENTSKREIAFRLGSTKEPLNENLRLLNRILILALLFISLVTPLGAYILAGRATRPLAKIISTTARLQPQNLKERLTIRGTGDELDRMSQTINGMLDRIASFIDRHRDFIADAAHELRSPLTAIRSSVEVALNRPRSSEEYQTLLADVMEECTSLADLVNRLLLLAEGDSGRLPGRDQSSSLDKLVRESLDMFQPVAESRGIDLRLSGIEEALVPGDEFHLRQVVRNLIDNAVKFTEQGGTVSVSVKSEREKKQVVLTVADTGAGIPPENLTRIFGRFFRADKSRHHQDGPRGYGLGLSICQSIVKALHGDIQVSSEVGRGSTFSVILPRAAEGKPKVRSDDSKKELRPQYG